MFQKISDEILKRYNVQITEFPFDGSIHRFGLKKEVWLACNEWEYKKQSYQKCVYGSWREGEQYEVTNYDKKEKSNDKSFKKSERKHQEELTAKLEYETQKKYKDCKEKWLPIFKKCSNNKNHQYLEHKGIDQLYCAKVDYNDVLLIPAYQANGFCGAQRIFFSHEENKYIKKFTFGIKKKGSVCPLSPFKKAKLVYVSEGYATAASVQMAFPDIPSICCFDAGNISNAIRTIRTINPDVKIVICADRDIDENPKYHKIGEKKAYAASKSYPNVIFRVVQFTSSNEEWSDFNDLHQFEGLKEVQEQLHSTETDFAEVICLGYRSDSFFYTSSVNPQIIPIKGGQHTKSNLRTLINDDYWQKKFPKYNTEEIIVGPDFDAAENWLKDQCRNKGFFDPEKIRGKGVWLDKNRIIVNTGAQLYVDKQKVDTIEDSTYFYQPSSPFKINLQDELSDLEAKHFATFLMKLKYKNNSDKYFLPAWVVQANMFSLLDWRPHIWLSGQRGSGKSTILKWIDSLLLSSTLEEDSSAAGIRQYLVNDAIPVIYDESEPDNNRVSDVITMARQSSSNNQSNTRRGTVSGHALNYNTQACFLMGSIQKAGMASADTSRFYVIEMDSIEDQTRKEFDDLSYYFNYFSKQSNRLFSRVVNNASTILQNIKIARSYLKGLNIEARLADQLSTTIGCFHILNTTKVIDDEWVETYVYEMNLNESDYMNDNKVTDGKDCLELILTLTINNQSDTVRKAIDDMENHQFFFEKELGAMGIRYDRESKSIFIAAKSRQLSDRLKKYSTYSDYFSILKRMDGAKEKRVRIKGFGNVRGILINIEGELK